MPAEDPAKREQEEDHDLLTYGEAGARLGEEVTAQRKRVAELESSAAPGLEAARARLVILQEAVERHTRDRTDNEDYERFFGDVGDVGDVVKPDAQ